jgi:SPP1 gp7 family putative phage head morphogenesis protein
MEERLTQIYTEAQEEIATKWYEYMKDAEKRLAPYEKAYQEAKESGDKQAIDNFGFALGREKQKVTLQNKYYDGMMNYTTKQLTHVNEVAVSYINGQMPKVYGINYNGTLQDIKTDAEKIGNIGVSFNLVDERTIRNLVTNGRIPFKEIDETKDEAWNKKAINSQILQGILQGESIPKIAGRLQNVTNMNEAAAIRNARTMTTAAENGGRFDAMKEADEKGIVYEKQWLATADDRTRETHAAIDGESVPLDDTFSNDLEYPGDPMGEASEVYNCRCTMVRNLIGFRKADGSVETVADEEYENPFTLPETRQEREERLQREAEEAAKQNNKIDFDEKFNTPKWAECKELIETLSNEYNTRLETVTGGAEKAAGDVDIMGSIMRLNTPDISTTIHEFAHTLANSNADKYGLTQDQDFWKDIKRVKRNYHKDVDKIGEGTERWISSYEHSTGDVNEFFAEAFTQAKMKEMGFDIPKKYGNDFTYSMQVLEITDKYFRKK